METARELTVEVLFKPNDVYTPFQWNRHNAGKWIAAAVLCLVLYGLYGGPGDTLRSFPDSGSIIAVLTLLTVLVLLALLLFPYLRLRSAFRETPDFKTPVRYTFGSEGMRFQSENARGEYKWSAFPRLSESRRAFVVWQTSYAGTYLPKRCFASKDDIVFFRQLIRDNFKGKWQLRRD